MESNGAFRILQWFVEKHSLQYTKYLGDGDASSFSIAKSANPYDTEVESDKVECIGHIQKRIWGRLWVEKWLEREKTQGWEKCFWCGLANWKCNNKLQSYLGIAIRTNLESNYGMKKCILASLFHISMIDINKWHQFCPCTSNSWCNS